MGGAALYIPKSFRMDDAREIASFLRDHSFGVMIAVKDGDIMATHVPFLYDASNGKLFAHLAKANPQASQLDGEDVMVVFQGPHAYISPSWYGLVHQVPTWNYMVVHVYGTYSVMEDKEQLAKLLQRTIHAYEPDSSLPEEANEPFYQNMMKAIVGFRIDITRIDGAAKLSQNKPADVQRRVITRLRSSASDMARQTADLMEKHSHISDLLSELSIYPLQVDERLPMDLLLSADPSRESIADYIHEGTCCIARLYGDAVGVYVTVRRDATTAQLMNIAVREDMQRNGIGKRLVLHAVDTVRAEGYQRLNVGTGNSSLHQLALYQRCGFRITSVDTDFFDQHYDQPIYENGLRCRDMIRLTRYLGEDAPEI